MLKHCVWHNVSAYLLHKYLVRYTSLSLQRTTGPDIVHAYQFTHYRRLVFGCFHRSVFRCLHRTSAGWTPSGATVWRKCHELLANKDGRNISAPAHKQGLRNMPVCRHSQLAPLYRRYNTGLEVLLNRTALISVPYDFTTAVSRM